MEIIARMLRFVEAPERDRRAHPQRPHHGPKPVSASRRPRSPARGATWADELKIESALVQASCRAAGEFLVSLRLRSEPGALVVGVRRGERLLGSAGPTVPFEPGDICISWETSEA